MFRVEVLCTQRWELGQMNLPVGASLFQSTFGSRQKVDIWVLRLGIGGTGAVP